MKIFFDTEFIDTGSTLELISLGMVREDGETLYVESSQTDLSLCDAWLKVNVLPHLRGPKLSRSVIAGQVEEFVGDDPQFWAWYSAYDWVVLCQLYGRMLDIPVCWPKFCSDLRTVSAQRGFKPPSPVGVEHDALADALWVRDAYYVLHPEQLLEDVEV